MPTPVLVVGAGGAGGEDDHLTAGAAVGYGTIDHVGRDFRCGTRTRPRVVEESIHVDAVVVRSLESDIHLREDRGRMGTR